MEASTFPGSTRCGEMHSRMTHRGMSLPLPQPNLFLVAIEGPLVVGSVMAGYDGHRGWISRIAVLRSHWRKGIGQALITEAEKRLEMLGCIKINLQVVASDSSVVGFYRRLGYEVEERISMSKRISPRH